MLVHLPYPPSINTYWRMVQGRLYISHKGRAYRERVTEIIAELKVKPFEGPLKVLFIVHPPDRRKRDIDNVQKAICDALTHAGAWEDDSQVVDMRTIKACVVRGGICAAEITPSTEELPDARILD